MVRRRTGDVGGAQCAVRPKTTHLLSVPKFLFRFVWCTDLICALKKLVRIELASLLSAKPPYGHTPPPSRIFPFTSEWKSSGNSARACQSTAEDFMIDLVGGPKSAWNVSAGRVFTDHFIEKTGRDDTPEIRKAVEKAFTNRIKGLKSLWKNDALSPTGKAAERSKHSRKQRKYQVCLLHWECHNSFICGAVIPTSL